KDYSDLVGFLARIAGDELKAKPISKADNSRLDSIGGVLEDFWWRTGDNPNKTPDPSEMAAVVADIASGRNHTTGEISV
ncbi:hypothetical protein NL523_29205, partial [Klebsiella pneumoniae]|nr:hypothetical protein [Klebsiella pneumoniae]MCP6663828.1 hypothetical protein [Klebsiella pneumoniae]